jgi:hypothetical protein
MISLRAIFDELNVEYFYGSLKIRKLYICPSLKYKVVVHGSMCKHRTFGVLGIYSDLESSISINPIIIDDSIKLREVIYHEMCHIIFSGHGRKFKMLMSRYRY